MTVTLSALHNLTMIRYYKFLVVNLVVFFCIGTSALELALAFIKNHTNQSAIKTVPNSFPSAAPFYVGWCMVFSHSSQVCLLSSPV